MGSKDEAINPKSSYCTNPERRTMTGASLALCWNPARSDEDCDPARCDSLSRQRAQETSRVATISAPSPRMSVSITSPTRTGRGTRVFLISATASISRSRGMGMFDRTGTIRTDIPLAATVVVRILVGHSTSAVA